MTAMTNSSNLREDRYPSRGGRTAGITLRRDPVVYSNAETNGPISHEQIEFYRTNGFVVIDQMFNEREISAFRAELARLWNGASLQRANEVITEPESGDIRSIFQIHSSSPVFSKLISDVRLAGLASYILGDDVYIHQSRLNYKPGFRGKDFYWHSDFETWHVEDGMPAMRALSISITLTDNFPHNGPLMLIPNSQNDYVTCSGDTPENHFQKSLKKQEYGIPQDECLAKLVNKGGIFNATCGAGSIIVFDCNTMHGSNSNISPDPRSNIFFVYNAMSNRVLEPFCDRPPRPEYICSRENISALKPKKYAEQDYTQEA